jgi:NAD/NADP transhydrogenase beta subunit
LGCSILGNQLENTMSFMNSLKTKAAAARTAALTKLRNTDEDKLIAVGALVGATVGLIAHLAVRAMEEV